MKTSVVIACYNGEKRIARQLESLKKQNRAADEVILTDDCSTDRTAETVREYIQENQMSKWFLSVNEVNKGWKENFFQALSAATGDLIFLCDQDDEWDPEKIERMSEVMAEKNSIDLLACDYRVRYEPGAVPMKRYSKKPEEREERVCQYQFTSRFFQNPSPGCTYAIRKRFLDGVKEYRFPEAPHDEFLWLMASMTDGAWFLNEELMTMNRYESNSSDIRYKDIRMQTENLQYISKMLQKMQEYAADSPEMIAPEKLKTISEAAKWCEKRQRLMETRNPFRWLAMFPYWKYYNSFRNCLSDLYLVLFGSFRRS